MSEMRGRSAEIRTAEIRTGVALRRRSESGARGDRGGLDPRRAGRKFAAPCGDAEIPEIPEIRTGVALGRSGPGCFAQAVGALRQDCFKMARRPPAIRTGVGVPQAMRERGARSGVLGDINSGLGLCRAQCVRPARASRCT